MLKVSVVRTRVHILTSGLEAQPFLRDWLEQRALCPASLLGDFVPEYAYSSILASSF